MSDNEKKYIQIKTKLEFYKKLDRKIDLVIDTKFTIEELSNEVYAKIKDLEKEFNNLKIDL